MKESKKVHSTLNMADTVKTLDLTVEYVFQLKAYI